MTTVSKEVKILIAFCAVANFINTADRVLLPICMVQMSKQYDWNLGFQGWVLSGFGFGYISSQVEFFYFTTKVITNMLLNRKKTEQ